MVHPGDGKRCVPSEISRLSHVTFSTVQCVEAIGEPPADKVCAFRDLKNVVVLPSVGASNICTLRGPVGLSNKIRRPFLGFYVRWRRLGRVRMRHFMTSDSNRTQPYPVISTLSSSIIRFCPRNMPPLAITHQSGLGHAQMVRTVLLMTFVTSLSSTSTLISW